LELFPAFHCNLFAAPLRFAAKDFRYNRGYRCREAVFALPQKKQKAVGT
jgi:hypothetical protein